jgi:hypothetical protein
MSMAVDGLDASRLRELFDELSTELAKRGQTGQLFVVGGAAMAMAYDMDRTTHDVDAVFEPTHVLRDLTALIGERHRLNPDWINDAAKGFLPGADDDPRTVYESASLYVQVASPRYLLAMKLFSGRSARDHDDAVKLWRIVGFTQADQGIELLEASYPAHILLPRHRFTVEQIAADATGRNQMSPQAMLAATALSLRPTPTAIPESEIPRPPNVSRGFGIER